MRNDRYKVNMNEKEDRQGFLSLHLNLLGMTVTLFSGPLAEEIQSKLKEVLGKIYSSENLLFLQAVHQLALMDDPQEGFAAVIGKFIAEGSEKQINISSDMAKDLLSAMKRNTLKLQDFKRAVYEVNILIDTSLNQVKPEDKNSLRELCVKQLSLKQNIESFIQELNETRAGLGIAISVNKNYALNESNQSLKQAINDFKHLKIGDKNYLKEFTSILNHLAEEQDSISKARSLKGSRDQSLVTAAYDSCIKMIRILSENTVEKEIKNIHLPSLKLATKPEQNKLKPVAEKKSHDFHFLGHREEKDNKTPTASTLPRLLVPLKRTK